MKQIVKKFNVYHFEELSEEVRAKVLSRLDLIEDDWYDCILKDWQIAFYNYGIEDAEFTFDLYYGIVGLSKAKFDLDKMLKAFCPEYTIKHNLKNWFLDISSCNLYGTDRVSIETNLYCGTYNHVDAYMESAASDIEKILDAGLQKLLKSVLEDLQREYDYWESDEAKKEFILDNDKWFLENGDEYIC